MPTFILSLNWTEQGIRSVKDAPKRAEASKELAKKVGVEIKQVYLTTGEDDLLVIVDAPNGDNVTKFALALGAQGNVRTRPSRAWPESNFKSSYPSFPERVGLKGDRQDRPAARRVLSGARGAPAGRSCASSSSGSGPPPGLCPRVVEGFRTSAFRNQTRWCWSSPETFFGKEAARQLYSRCALFDFSRPELRV